MADKTFYVRAKTLGATNNAVIFRCHQVRENVYYYTFNKIHSHISWETIVSTIKLMLEKGLVFFGDDTLYTVIYDVGGKNDRLSEILSYTGNKLKFRYNVRKGIKSFSYFGNYSDDVPLNADQLSMLYSYAINQLKNLNKSNEIPEKLIQVPVFFREIEWLGKDATSKIAIDEEHNKAFLMIRDE